MPEGVLRVALTVDAGDEALEALFAAVPIDMLQLHGRETPERVAEVRARFGRPVMKAVGIAGEADLVQIDAYARVADQILVDARPPRGADRPGGNGQAFDWRLIAGQRWKRPWMLAGGLTPDNVAEAVRLIGRRAGRRVVGRGEPAGVQGPRTGPRLRHRRDGNARGGAELTAGGLDAGAAGR